MGFKKRRSMEAARADGYRTQLAVERLEHRAKLRRLRTSLRNIQKATAQVALELGDAEAAPELKRNNGSSPSDNAPGKETAETVAKRVAAHSELTRQQTAVLLLFVQNLSKDEVAEALGIGRETLRSHITEILRKTEDTRIAELLRRIRTVAARSS